MRRQSPTCTAHGCTRKSVAKSLCRLHYQRVRQGVDLDQRERAPDGAPLAFCVEAANAPDTVTECIEWPYAASDGRGHIYFRGRGTIASRVVCILAHGEPPTPTHEAAHSCGKGHRLCVNPHHLRWATVIDNHADKRAHGTLLAGERTPAAKLTNAQVATIKRMIIDKVTDYKIARQFGMGDEAIRQIRLGNSWKSVPWPDDRPAP